MCSFPVRFAGQLELAAEKDPTASNKNPVCFSRAIVGLSTLGDSILYLETAEQNRVVVPPGRVGGVPQYSSISRNLTSSKKSLLCTILNPTLFQHWNSLGVVAKVLVAR